MKTTLKPKICKNPDCENEFMPFRSLDKYCSFACAITCENPIKPISKKGIKTIKADETFYAKVLENRVKNGILKCDNCGVNLDPELKDENGNVKQKWRFSHRQSKGSRPDLRHNINNVDCLCFQCHQQWEFGDRSNMKIYNNN